MSLEQARPASRRYAGSSDDVFSRCFVCGKAREDSFEVFAGPAEGRRLVASPWTPPPWTADASGRVRPEFVWAALDCPTYFAAYMGEEGTVSMLARFTARIEPGADVSAAAEHVVIAWPLEAEGRKRHAGAALLSAEGETWPWQARSWSSHGLGRRPNAGRSHATASRQYTPDICT